MSICLGFQECETSAAVEMTRVESRGQRGGCEGAGSRSTAWIVVSCTRTAVRAASGSQAAKEGPYAGPFPFIPLLSSAHEAQNG
jgi:hypothetical protein